MSTSKVTLKEETQVSSPTFLTLTGIKNKFEVNNFSNYMQINNEYEVELKHGSKIKSRLLNRNWSSFRKISNVVEEEKQVNM